VAVDTDTGRERWRFHADYPIRYAPCATSEAVYVGDDGGNLLCLGAATGELRWKLPAAPEQGQAPYCGDLAGRWPVTCGSVLYEGRVYFAVGRRDAGKAIVVAADAATGREVWRREVPGVSCWGYLTAAGGVVLMPVFDAHCVHLDANTGQATLLPNNRDNRYGSLVAANRTH